MAPIAVTGVPKHGAGPAPPRLEIQDFVKNIRHFSLYCQALLELQAPGAASQVFSFEKIAGIHGKPALAWNESPPPSQYGYCVHGTYNFPTWHRPCMAAMEQGINQIALKIAGTYPLAQRAAWQTAAANLRQPFWDWAKNAVPPPEVISLEKVHIISPTGPKDIQNPFLYYMPIQATRNTFGLPYRNWPRTLRHPNSTAPDAHSNVPDLIAVLQASQAQIRNAVQLLWTLTTWPAFSTHSAGSGGGASSLEGIHDVIHVRVGGNSGGHMSDASVSGKSLASFDPIFFLHHAQIDHLLSLWSTLHPGVWVPPAANQDLRPFWTNPPTSFWKSNSVATTDNTLNYTYPEFVHSVATAADSTDPISPEPVHELIAPEEVPKVMQDTLPQPFNKLFDTHAVKVTKSQTKDHAQAYLAAAYDHVEEHPTDVLPNWTAHVTCKQYAYGSSFSVFFFFGELPQDLKHWYKSPNFVGSFDTFVNSDPDSCKNCQSQSELDVEGFVHLNLSLVERGLTSLAPDAVVPYLTENLHWGILTKTGQVEDLESLQVRIMLYPLSKPTGSHFPIAGHATYYDGITAGRRHLGGPA